VETVDGVNSEPAKILAGKEERRQRLAHLPFPEKVPPVIRLQNMTAAILRSRANQSNRGKIPHLRLKAPNLVRIVLFFDR